MADELENIVPSTRRMSQTDGNHSVAARARQREHSRRQRRHLARFRSLNFLLHRQLHTHQPAIVFSVSGRIWTTKRVIR
jgi:hypothetical protein